MNRHRVRVDGRGSLTLPWLLPRPAPSAKGCEPRGRLSEIQIGNIRRSLHHVLEFVPSPAPKGGPEVIQPWCRKVCSVDTLAEVGKQWAKCLTDLGGTLFFMGLAE